MTPQVVYEPLITAAEDAAIRAGLCVCFPDDRDTFSQTRSWHGTHPTWSVFVEQQGQVIAHVGVVDRQILVGMDHVRVAGIQNVFVLPEHRKTSLFPQVMAVAMKEAARNTLDLGILFCVPGLANAYARIGWRLLEPRNVVRTDEQGVRQPLPGKNITMFYPLIRDNMPPGNIDLLGNDW